MKLRIGAESCPHIIVVNSPGQKKGEDNTIKDEPDRTIPIMTYGPDYEYVA